MALARTTDLIYENNVAPTGSNNFAAGFKVGDDWRDTVTGKVYTCTGNGVWTDLVLGLAAGKEVKFAFAAGAARANTASYVVVARFGWDGSNILGTPLSIKSVVYTSATNYSIRVYDLTNALEVTSLTGQTNMTPAIKDLGALANISATPAIWEIQMLRNGGGFAELDSLSIKFA